MRASVLAVPLVLTVLTGCGMTDEKSDGVPFAGTSTSLDAADTMERASSEIYDLLGVKGKASESLPGVMDCSGKDTKTYFRIFHPWSFTPAAASDLDEAMERLKGELPKHGWEIVEYGPNTSKNKNITLTADNDKKKVSVKVTQMAKNDPPKLSLNLVSGCYNVPDGEEVERF
ncbi:hypothetical protein HRW18_30235 [Streptomyces lunaelactis]|nr:hypothetical protein [Streptomyces lunaelactis]NUK37789.1 hypothetical protein [Streptomyces lunaelactis]NUK44291.1 hypothetical protein [Streptomyces lunaelactis]NUK96158.1 hypothetical protein [Streptomyces lunaelactis]NUL13725.1 hypothetical protein [Streptomyces lunaelactis]